MNIDGTGGSDSGSSSRVASLYAIHFIRKIAIYKKMVRLMFLLNLIN